MIFDFHDTILKWRNRLKEPKWSLQIFSRGGVLSLGPKDYLWKLLKSTKLSAPVLLNLWITAIEKVLPYFIHCPVALNLSLIELGFVCSSFLFSFLALLGFEPQALTLARQAYFTTWAIPLALYLSHMLSFTIASWNSIKVREEEEQRNYIWTSFLNNQNR
jgi:hypothetical protein